MPAFILKLILKLLPRDARSAKRSTGIAIVIILSSPILKYTTNTSLSIDITQSNAVKWKYRKYPIYIKNIRYFRHSWKYRDIFHPCM